MGRNTIFISGTVSQMPRYRDVQTKDGTRTVMSFNVPTDHGWGERKTTTFFECEHWLPPTERGANYLTHVMGKGAKVAVTGEFYIDTWTEVMCPAPAVDVKDEPQERTSAPQNGSQDVYDSDIPF